MNKTESSTGKIFYGWWIVIASIFLGLFLTSLTNYSFTAFIEPIAYEFAWSYSQISVAASLRMMEIGLMAPVIGWLIDRWGIKKVVLAGSVIMCTGLLLFANMHSLAMYYIAFFLIGVGGSAGSQPAVQTVLAKWFPPQARSGNRHRHSGIRHFRTVYTHRHNDYRAVWLACCSIRTVIHRFSSNRAFAARITE